MKIRFLLLQFFATISAVYSFNIENRFSPKLIQPASHTPETTSESFQTYPNKTDPSYFGYDFLYNDK